MTGGPITTEQLIEAVGILAVVCIMLGAIGAIVVNRMRCDGGRSDGA